MRSSLLHRSTQEESKKLFCIFINFIVFSMNIQILNEFTGNLNWKSIWKLLKKLKQCQAVNQPKAL
jgi:hypothetical protein